jgi:hypothetical protein
MARKKSNRKGLYSLFIIVIALLFLLTNPSKSDFQTFIQDQVKGQPENDVESMIRGMVSIPAMAVMGQITERKNYFFFSTYTIEFTGKKTVYLGIVDQFIRVK